MEKRLCSKLGIVLIIVGSVFILTTAAALAASNSQLDSSEPNAPGTKADAFTLSVTGMVSPTQPISGNNMIANTIALFFGTEVTEVVGLRSDGFGYGEIAKVYFLATAAATDTTSIVEMRESKMGWGQIAKALGQHPGNKGNNLGMIVSGRGTLSDTMSDTTSVAGGITPTASMTGSNMIANSIALFFGTEVTEVLGLRADGFGYGEIAKVYFLATAAATDTTSIVEMRESKMGWGQIAKAVGEHPGNKGNNLGMIVSGRGTISDTVAAGEADTSTVGSHGQGNAYGQQKEQGNQGRGQEQGKGHDKEHDQGKGHDKEHGGGKKD